MLIGQCVYETFKTLGETSNKQTNYLRKNGPSFMLQPSLTRT